jgi:hypothetical protein
MSIMNVLTIISFARSDELIEHQIKYFIERMLKTSRNYKSEMWIQMKSTTKVKEQNGQINDECFKNINLIDSANKIINLSNQIYVPITFSIIRCFFHSIWLFHISYDFLLMRFFLFVKYCSISFSHSHCPYNIWW